MKKYFGFIFTVVIFSNISFSQQFNVKDNYIKKEVYVPMRDGVKLFTSIYIPRDSTQNFPIMLNRTPYSVAPYGTDNYRNMVGPSQLFAEEKYIFANQDVRGRYMSEGEFVMMRPQIKNKKSRNDIDESSDTWDTIEWLLKNVSNNNGKVGQYGISYPGFYTAVGTLSNHPALIATSPQAPMNDTWLGDDFHHNGAFFLPHAFGFLNGFKRERSGPTQQYKPGIQFGTEDGYKFFLEMGALKNANKKYFHDSLSIWNEQMTHGNYDDYWKSQNVAAHFNNFTPVTMIVGGWYDSEDLYGPLKLYEAAEKSVPKNTYLVMGPWTHGGWSRNNGDTLGDIRWEPKTASWYRSEIELPFFNYYLKGKGTNPLSEATIFETGKYRWHKFNEYPPKESKLKNFYLHQDGSIKNNPPKEKNSFSEYVNDPKKPVPFTQDISMRMGTLYKVEDQRFVWNRPDVISFETEILNDDLTFVGPITAHISGSTSGTDCDWVVKVIDVYPDSTKNTIPNPRNAKMSGYQQLVRAEIMRSKYRDQNWSNPKPMVKNKITKIDFELQDIMHTFKKGHRVMIQIQSSWFPIADRNPGKFLNIYEADDSDFQKTTQRVYHSAENQTYISVRTMKVAN
ncbi:MAG: CocE/NonD family hydrolase [Bacteroidetes bacterium]|nr:CocE/NonD family hydrolase [Bacteroidota bacterium]